MQLNTSSTNLVLGQTVKNKGRSLEKGALDTLLEPPEQGPVCRALLPAPRQLPAAQKQGLYSCSIRHLIHEKALQELN